MNQACLFREYEEVEQALYPQKAELENLDSFNRIIICSSGGKDSDACTLYLVNELKVPKEKVVIWHQAIDGSPGETPFMDWPITDSYVRAFGEALGIKTEFQWRNQGFYGELMRENSKTNDVQYQNDGKVITLPTRNGKESTRRKFPAKTADLRIRWCSAYLKIDVMRRVLNNHPDYQEGKYLVITGERREESVNRAKYMNVEKHPCSNKKRQVTWWRSVIDWSETQIWDLMEKYKVYPHPAYWLGWSRTSCFGCIFSTFDQWSMMREISPERFSMLVELEKEFKHTLDNKSNLIQLADRGRARIPKGSEKMIKLALEGDISPEDIIMNQWELPAGAFTGSAGGAP